MANGTGSSGGVVIGNSLTLQLHPPTSGDGNIDPLLSTSSVANMPGGTGVTPATPGTPITKAKDVSIPSPRIKIVVALYPFKAIESGDLSLEKNAEYEVIDDSQEHWWKVKNQHAQVGYIPSNYVKAKELLGLEKYE